MSSINWELMEKIFYAQQPEAFKKSLFWDYRSYDIKFLNEKKSIDDRWEFWQIVEKIELSYTILTDLESLSDWVREKQEQYLGETIRLDSYSQYRSYPETEQIYCLIIKRKETEQERDFRFSEYFKEQSKIEKEQNEKLEQKRKKEEKEYLRLKKKFESEDL